MFDSLASEINSMLKSDLSLLRKLMVSKNIYDQFPQIYVN